MKYILLISFLFLKTIVYCQIKDIDNNNYDEVKIGKSIWMGSNLRVTHFNNGDEIFYAKSAEEMASASYNKTPAYCDVDFDSTNDKLYGKVYNSFAILDYRGILPEGYNIPTEDALGYIYSYIFDPLKDSLFKLNIKSDVGIYGSGTNKNLSYFYDALKPDTITGQFRSDEFDKKLAKFRNDREIEVLLNIDNNNSFINKNITYNKNLSLGFNFQPAGFLRTHNLFYDLDGNIFKSGYEVGKYEKFNKGGWLWIISQDKKTLSLKNIYPSKRGGGDFRSLACVVRCVKFID